MSVVEKSATSTIAGERTADSAKSGFIIGPLVDSVLIIGSPILAIFVAAPLYSFPKSSFDVSIHARPMDLRDVLITIFIQAHLLLVFFRSHGNQNIFRLYPVRFTAVPIGLFALGALSPVALAVMGMVAVWWDVYHSSLQTFGFARIYDAKKKNSAAAGRSLDYWMNLFMYLGPVLAGAHFIDHLNYTTKPLKSVLADGSALSELLIQTVPDFLQEHQIYLAIMVIAIGLPFIGYYLYSYYRLHQGGYQVSWQKVWLMIITSTVSIYCWGFRSFFDAFFVMNFFHALQYFTIVIAVEKNNLAQIFRVDRYSQGWMLAAFWVVALTFLHGAWCMSYGEEGWPMSLLSTIAIMHFWYDGFVWSVTKKQV